MNTSTFRFGQHIIKASAVFLQTELSFALVNRKPVVPGRILPSIYIFFPKACYDSGRRYVLAGARQEGELTGILV
ncbi:hypothetical protein COCON_G00175860 [Conger conger]|uniref:Uncharacterized protein n=1 Tax=Conger conger TaxID=82655 RepID=A0A9Q1D4J2_CONCO|nr:hypothetical protein COCON_G00175860 [Conger conger]